jgi:hypothetical protein
MVKLVLVYAGASDKVYQLLAHGESKLPFDERMVMSVLTSKR